MVDRLHVALLVLMTLAVARLGASTYVSVELEQRAIARIEQVIRDNRNKPRGDGLDNPAAKLVRLSFHDCMVKCDGCVNLNNQRSSGLRPIYNAINGIYDNEGYGDSEMSRADFIALAGITAVYEAASRQNCSVMGMTDGCTPPRPTLTPRYGRQDCDTSPTTTVVLDFPNPHGDLEHVLSVFGEGGMGMTPRQVVALMGAHSLGDTNPENSGFNGPWVLEQDVFDNEFFQLLVNATDGRDWFQVETNFSDSPGFPAPQYQWVTQNITTMGEDPDPPPIMMLNTDMSLLRYIQPNEDGSENDTTCRSNASDCRWAMTAQYVEEFARNNTAFHEAFGPAFQILIENGYEPNDLVPSGASGISAQLFIISAAVVIISLLY